MGQPDGLDAMAGLVLLFARWVIAGIFLRSGISKSLALTEFRSAVANYKLLPAGLVTPVAFGLPFAEIAAAVLLGVGVLPVLVAAALAVLLTAFSVAIGVNLARGRVFDCGCAGSAAAPRLISWRHVAADLVLAGAAVAVAVAPPPANAWPGVAGVVSVSMPGGGAVPALLAVALCLVMTALLRRALTVRVLVTEAKANTESRRG
jgi:Methylamine utilisation protein MauE